MFALDYNKMHHCLVDVTKMIEGGCPQEVHSLKEIKAHIFKSLYYRKYIDGLKGVGEKLISTKTQKLDQIYCWQRCLKKGWPSLAGATGTASQESNLFVCIKSVSLFSFSMQFYF